jgi:hypothetical protein
MAVTVITEESEKSPQPSSENSPSQEDKTLEMNMAAQFGAMTESNRQLQEKLTALEIKYEQAISSGQSSQSEINSLRQRIDDLIARLEEPDEEDTSDTEPVVPPQIQTPVTDKPVKGKRNILHKIIYG